MTPAYLPSPLSTLATAVLLLVAGAADAVAQSPACDIALIQQTFTNAGYAELAVAGQPCSMYFYNTATTSANDAQAAAQAVGANLVSIQDQGENDALQAALQAAGFSNALVWIGGGFSGGNHGPNDFTWYDGSPNGFINWNPGEPNDNSGIPGVGENCMQMVVASGQWNDLVCGAEPIGLGPTGTSVIEVNLCPELTVTGLGGQVCTGDQVNLSSSALFGSTSYTYAWFVAPNPVPVAMGQDYAPSVSATTTYVAGVQDVYSCADTVMFTITPTACTDCSAFLPPTVTSTPTACAGSTGTATATPQGGTAPYSVVWNTNPPQNGLTATDLPAGDHDVTVTDANGCVQTATVTVSTDAGGMTVSITGVVHPTCSGDCDGQATAVVQSGTAPLAYDWSTGSIADQVLTLCDGDHTVTVTDGNGCVATASVTIEEPQLLEFTVSVTETTCPGTPTGTATLTVTGGTAPYASDWGTLDPDALPEGDHGVEVVDANGCAATETFTILSGSGIGFSLSIIDNVCFGGSDGEATVALNGGTAPYDVLWADAFGNPLLVVPGSNGNSTLTSLSSGVYNVAAQDATGCANAFTFTITQPPLPLTLTLTPQHLLCNEGADGEVTASQNGLSPFQYDISDIFGNPVGNAVNTGPHTFTGLAADTYFVTVVDANGCQNTDTVLLNQPTPISAEGIVTPINCFGADDGMVEIVNVTGGTAPFAPTVWSAGPQTGNIFTGLGPGNVTATVIDANGCQLALDFLLTEPLEMQLEMSYLTDTCGQGKGSAIANVSLGTPPYSYLWDVPFPSATFRQDGLPVGVYSVNVSDANGCTRTDSVAVMDDLPYPSAAFSSRIEGETVLDQEVQFINSSAGTIEWSWNFGDGGFSDLEDPTHRYSKEGDYLVQLLASNGFCADTAYGYVNIDPLLVIYVPNAFTPGINGINDTFYPQGEGIEKDSYEMFIYDRWGKQVWRTDNFRKEWDGTDMYSLQPVPVGTYTWLIRFREFADIDRYELRGKVLLIRD